MDATAQKVAALVKRAQELRAEAVKTKNEADACEVEAFKLNRGVDVGDRILDEKGVAHEVSDIACRYDRARLFVRKVLKDGTLHACERELWRDFTKIKAE